MKSDRTAPLVVAPGEGRMLSRSVRDGGVIIKLPSRMTSGAVTVWESHRSAGDTKAPGPHSHPGYDEIFYVLAGEYAFIAAGRRFTAPAGTLVFMPGWIFHRFASTGGTEGRVLHLAVPGSTEDALDEMAFAEGGELIMLKSVRPTIAVRDKEKAKEFFGGTLGLTLADENPVGATFQAGDTFLEVYPSQFAGSAKSTVAGFEVDDLEATMATFRQRGIEFEDYDLPGLKTTSGIAQLGPNRGSWFKDPDGNIFGLVELGQTT